MGDMNARTKDHEDVVLYPGDHGEDDILSREFNGNPKCPRNNQDVTGNKYGKKLVEFATQPTPI